MVIHTRIGPYNAALSLLGSLSVSGCFSGVELLLFFIFLFFFFFFLSIKLSDEFK